MTDSPISCGMGSPQMSSWNDDEHPNIRFGRKMKLEDTMLKFSRLKEKWNRRVRESSIRDALWESEMREKYEKELVER